MVSYPSWIMQRSFGGTRVADTPGNDLVPTRWPTGKSAPSAKECCDNLIEACKQTHPPSASLLVFLVGGAGNGKSCLASQVTQHFESERVDRKATFASRAYDYSLRNGKIFRVVNDATIPPREESASSPYLLHDIKYILEGQGNLLACVNRGVLVSELDSLDNLNDDDPHALGAKVIAVWLFNRKEELGLSWKLVNVESGGHYYSYCELEGPIGVVGYVHVVFMDQVSMLEPFPSRSVQESNNPYGPLSPGRPEILPIDLRRGSNGKEIPAYGVVADFVDNFHKDCLIYPGGDLDPVKANVSTMRDTNILGGICSVLRGAEVISGNHLTYRDIWGLSVLGVTGSIPGNGLATYSHWVTEMVDFAKNGDSSEKRLRAITQLAMRRINVSWFSGKGPKFLLKTGEQPSYPRVQAMELLAMADPLLSLPTNINIKLKEKLALLDEHKGPGAALAREESLFAKAWGPLDEHFEEALLRWLYESDSSHNFKQRNEMMSWYGQYLFRLYCMVHGCPAHLELVKLWQETWIKASSKQPLHQEIERGLNSLVFVPDERGQTHLPVFSSRATPISKGENRSRVAITIGSNAYHWSMRKEGDQILFDLRKHSQPGKKVAEFLLDFPMLREVCVRVAGSGFTEMSIDVEPRIERIRAEILSMESRSVGQNGGLPVVFFDGSTVIS